MEDHTFDMLLGDLDEVGVLVWDGSAFGGLVTNPYAVAELVVFDHCFHEVGAFLLIELFEIMDVALWDEHEVVIDEPVVPHIVWEAVFDHPECSVISREVLIRFIKCTKFAFEIFWERRSVLLVSLDGTRFAEHVIIFHTVSVYKNPLGVARGFVQFV